MNKTLIAVLLGAASLYQIAYSMEKQSEHDRFTTKNNHYCNNTTDPWAVKSAPQEHLDELNTWQRNNNDKPVYLGNIAKAQQGLFRDPETGTRYNGKFLTYYYNGEYLYYLTGYEPTNVETDDQSIVCNPATSKSLWQQPTQKIVWIGSGVCALAALIYVAKKYRARNNDEDQETPTDSTSESLPDLE